MARTKDINIYVHLPKKEDREVVFKAFEAKGIEIYPATRTHETLSSFENLIYKHQEKTVTGNRSNLSAKKESISSYSTVYIAETQEIFINSVINLHNNNVVENSLIEK